MGTIIIGVGIGAIASGGFLDQIRTGIGIGGTAASCTGDGFQISIVIIGIGLSRFLHQRMELSVSFPTGTGICLTRPDLPSVSQQ